ncbi:MAG: family 43 glycosylhydrolase, partial [Oscillospiraceae bacterium]|nr:family 43 glycosylhydrolase [Oscillospiraceae bacterium]
MKQAITHVNKGSLWYRLPALALALVMLFCLLPAASAEAVSPAVTLPPLIGGEGQLPEDFAPLSIPKAESFTDIPTYPGGNESAAHKAAPNVLLRDTSVQYIAAEGKYYLVATSGGEFYNWWGAYNKGIRMWESEDMDTWTQVDGKPGEHGERNFVCYIDDISWWPSNKALWAPEFYCVNGLYYIVASTPHLGQVLLVSSTGKPEGPYEDALGRPIIDPINTDIDGSLFQDDDGKVYFLCQNGKIAEMSTDPVTGRITGLASGFSLPHSGHGTLSSSNSWEGAALFKHEGVYYLSLAYFGSGGNGRYDSTVLTATNVWGPYGNEHVAIQYGGHNTYFHSADGAIYGTTFCNWGPIYSQQAGIVKMQVTADGKLQPVYGDGSEPTPGLVNLALSSHGSTASASSEWSSTYNAGQALDDDFTTNTSRWAAGNKISSYGKFPETLAVDLKDVYNIEAARLIFERSNAAYQYRLEYSVDGVTWALFADQSANTRATNQTTDYAPDGGPIQARYLRAVVTGVTYQTPLASIYEFQIWGYDEAVSLPVAANLSQGLANGSYTASSTYQNQASTDTYGVNAVFDGSLSSRWCANNSEIGQPSWLKVNLGAVREISYVKSFFEKAYRTDPALAQIWSGNDLLTTNARDWAYKYLIEYSIDGAIWHTFRDRSDSELIGPTYDTAPGGSVIAQYLRITVTTNTGPGGVLASIFEFQVFGSTTPPTRASGVTLLPETLEFTLAANRVLTGQLTAEVTPANAADKNVGWESSDSAVAIVDGNGLVTVVGKGTATITVTTNDGGFTDSCAVTVSKTIPTLGELTYTLPAGLVYSGSPQGAIVTAAPGVAGLGDITVYYNGSADVPADAGTYAVTADLAEGASFEAAAGFELGSYTIAPAQG